MSVSIISGVIALLSCCYCASRQMWEKKEKREVIRRPTMRKLRMWLDVGRMKEGSSLVGIKQKNETIPGDRNHASDYGRRERVGLGLGSIFIKFHQRNSIRCVCN